MNDVLGIVNAIGNGYSVEELTQQRPLATVPFGGRYRLVDFALSGMFNSGVSKVGLLTPSYQRSMINHLRAGMFGVLAGNDKLTLLAADLGHIQTEQAKEVTGFFRNLEFIKSVRQNTVVIIPAGVVGNFNFQDAVQCHRETGADVTLLYSEQLQAEYDCDNHLNIEMNKTDRVINIKDQCYENNQGNCWWGAFILSKELLTTLIEESYQMGYDNLIHSIELNLNKLDTRAFHYSGYLARVHCLASYFRHSMALLNPDIWEQLFRQPAQIHTIMKDEPPSRYGWEAEVSQALISNGCLIRGVVDHSILFRHVTIQTGAKIKHSILMPNTRIAEDVVLEYVICDKNVEIGPGQLLQGKPDKPLFIKKGTVI